jgi:proline iminopeptidase
LPSVLEILFHALGFSRIVTHYVRHNLWLEDGILIANASALRNIRGALVNGRFDFQAPMSNAWELKRVWSAAEMVIVDDAGHGTPEIGRALVRATDHFASVDSG